MKKKYLILILSILFILIMTMMLLNKTVSIDNYIYSVVSNNFTNISFWKFVTILGSTKFIIGLCVLFLIIFLIFKNKFIGIYITSALIFSTIVNNIIKIIIRRERPEVTRYVIENSYSFPSGHTMAATMMYGILAYFIYKSNFRKWLKLCLILLNVIIIIMVSISRIILGAHFFSDVIGGIILSIALLLIVISIIEKKEAIK